MTNLSALQLLLQGYLGLDWLDDYEGPWAAVDDFLRSEPVQARLLPSEIEGLLALNPSEAMLRNVVVDELGSGYLPESDGLTYGEWLLHLLRRAEGASGAK